MCQRKIDKIEMSPFLGFENRGRGRRIVWKGEKRIPRLPARSVLCLYASQGNTREDPMIEVGAEAPDFALRSHQGEQVSLSQFRGDKWVVLHTFPLAFTGG